MACFALPVYRSEVLLNCYCLRHWCFAMASWLSVSHTCWRFGTSSRGPKKAGLRDNPAAGVAPARRWLPIPQRQAEPPWGTISSFRDAAKRTNGLRYGSTSATSKNSKLCLPRTLKKSCDSHLLWSKRIVAEIEYHRVKTPLVSGIEAIQIKPLPPRVSCTVPFR